MSKQSSQWSGELGRFEWSIERWLKAYPWSWRFTIRIGLLSSNAAIIGDEYAKRNSRTQSDQQAT